MSRGFDVTRLYDLNAIGVKNTVLLMLGRVQHHEAPKMLAAIATLFLGMCKRYRAEPRRVLDVTDRIMRDAQDKHPAEMRAMARFFQEELPDA